MKIWIVSRDEYKYDEYDSHVVRAETAAEAIELVRSDRYSEHEDWSSPQVIELLRDGEPSIVHSSFNAG